MLYLIQIYEVEQPDSTSKRNQYTVTEASRENDLLMRENGQLLVTIKVQSGAPTETISFCNGEVVTCEAAALSGIYVIQAHDMNDALRTASNMPQARLGRVEIRSVSDIDTK